ncbi:MAG: lipid II flippase MurJ, partial [Pauljensenia sp.]
MSSNTPRRSILRASALMASGTMVSRILGFVRNAMLIAAVGATAGGVGAAFQTANTLPNTVFNLLASGIFDAVLVPQIVGAIKRRSDGDTYVNRLLTLAGTVLFLVTFVTMVLAPVLVMITAVI